MNRLPATVDDLRGLRAARWIRESTTGQFDRYGPEAQAELQDAAIARLGLADTGLEWRIAHSGRTVYRSPAMAAMLDAAATGAFDVLLVGYVVRWQRNLRQTLNLLEDVLHPAGVAVWFADEQILSSCERDWDQLVAEATDAERYSRRLSRRIREGYASKLTKQRDPGGRAPFGFRRDERKLLEPVPAQLDTVRKAFELAAARLTDRVVAAETGIRAAHGPRHAQQPALCRPPARRLRHALRTDHCPRNLGRRTGSPRDSPHARRSSGHASDLCPLDAALLSLWSPAHRGHRPIPPHRAVRGLYRRLPRPSQGATWPASPHAWPQLPGRGV